MTGQNCRTDTPFAFTSTGDLFKVGGTTIGGTALGAKLGSFAGLAGALIGGLLGGAAGLYLSATDPKNKKMIAAK